VGTAPAVTLATSSVHASEGVFHMTVKTPESSGTLVFSISSAGARSDLVMQGKTLVRSSELVRPDHRSVAYRIGHDSRSYREVDLTAERKHAKAAAAAWRVAKLGDETIKGYDCVHARVTSPAHEVTEVWMTGAIASPTANLLMEHRSPALMNALASAGAKGFIVKLVRQDAAGATMSIELDRVEKTLPDPSLFEIPSGYVARVQSPPPPTVRKSQFRRKQGGK
jgi:hypothetical protein